MPPTLPSLHDSLELPLDSISSWSGSFSHRIPGWQLHWDSTSYGSFSTCPFYYYLTQIQGINLRHRSVHLAFGIAWHSAQERFHRLRATGLSYAASLHWTIAETLFRQLRTPEEHQRNQGFHEESVPVGPLSHVPAKTPTTLIRSLIQYFDSHRHDDLHTVILPSGRPAVELSFSFDLDLGDSDQTATYRGHMDRVVSKGVELDFSAPVLPPRPWPVWNSDYKTTAAALNERYFSQFTPDIQMTGYTLGSGVVLPEPGRGTIIDAVQLGVTGAQFARGYITRSPEALKEFISDLQIDIQRASFYAKIGSWPMNRKACRQSGRDCEFRLVCASPNSRSSLLRADFKRERIWDPTKTR